MRGDRRRRGGARRRAQAGTGGPGGGGAGGRGCVRHSHQLAQLRFDESREAAFYRAIRRYFPGLKDGTLRPGYTGIRPKIHGRGEPAPDFVIQGPRDHGVPGLVNLYGIESPGLTSSLAIADFVESALRG